MKTWEGKLFKMLLTVADNATEEADRVIYEAIHAAAPELSASNTQVNLAGARSEEAFETILSNVEGEMKLLCAKYDYRKFLHVSRLCSAVPKLKREEKNDEDTRVRTLSADRWILRYSPRSLPQDYLTPSGNDYYLSGLSNSMCHDAAKLHVLAHYHQRMVVERLRFNFMRLISSRNKIESTTLRLHEDCTCGWDLNTTELMGSLLLFNKRDQHDNGVLALWGMVDVPAENEYFALVTDPNPSQPGPFFIPRTVSLDAWLEYGLRFRDLFERDTGMPPEHFWAISRALGNLGRMDAIANGGRLRRWADLTGTVPIRRDDLLGGRLTSLAAAQLDGLVFPGVKRKDLDRSVDRFVRLASSTVGTPALSIEAVDSEGESLGADTLRSTLYPYMIHGTDEHDYWIVDYLMTVPFIRGVVNELRFDRNSRTTSSRNNDKSVRTSVFDALLNRQLTGIPGYEAAFPSHREDQDLPNITFSFNGKAENREIDIALRLGQVLITVQTWTSTVNARARAGEKRAVEKRWDDAKEKLSKTDRRYTNFLLSTEEGRKLMQGEGLRYILPVVCGPYAEPIVSLKPKFWLRYPRFESQKTVEESQKTVEDAVPRILTPPELVAFLGDATERELITICKENSWAL